MKRFIGFLFVFLLLVAMLSVSAVAAEEEMTTKPTFVVSAPETVDAGETFTVTVSVKNNTGIAGFELSIGYDENLLEWTDVEEGEWEGNWDCEVGSAATWYGSEDVTEDAVILTLTFQAKSAVAGETSISVSYDEENVYDIDEKNVSFEIENATVRIPCTNHTWDKGTVTQEGSCTEDTITEYTCTVCGETKNETTEATGHTPELNAAVDATCTEEGNDAYWYCSTCGKYFSNETCTTETTVQKQTIAALGHDYESVVTAPTCTDKGYTTYTCSRCDDSYVANYTEMIDHSYEGKVTTEPTCTGKGVKTYTCSVCGTTKTEDVAAQGHDLTQVEAKAANCTEAGNGAYYTCSRCDKLFSDAEGNTETSKDAVNIAATGHEWGAVVWSFTDDGEGTATYTCQNDETHTETAEVTRDNGEVISKPTCASTGTTKYTYTATHDRQTDTVTHEVTTAKDPANHAVELTAVEKKEATCTEDGYEAYWQCGKCSAMYSDEAGMASISAPVTIAALGHSYNDGEVTTQPTCTEAGVMTYTCQRTGCGETKVDAIEALGHDYQQSEKKDATCTEAGYIKYKCSRGDDGYTETLSALGHLFDTNGDGTVDENDDSYVVVTPAECETDGEYKLVCQRDGCTYEETGLVIPATDHVLANGVYNNDATCTEMGTTTYTCSECGKVITKTDVAALGHDYVATVTEPTCTAQGYTTHTCSRCGDSYVDTYTAMTEHDCGMEVTTEPTCTKQGVMTFTCKDCGYSYTESIEALGHKTEVQGAKDATCTAKGYTGDTVCTVCGETITKGTETPMTDHTYDSGKVTKEATTEAEGVKTYTCTVCGATKTETIAKLQASASEDEKEQTRTEIDEDIVISDSLKDAGFATQDAVVEEMTKTVMKNQGYTAKNVVSYDVKLEYSTDGGKTWQIATKDQFPEEGITVTLPYPAGTNSKDYDFVVIHMFAEEMNGHKPGETETLTVTETADGLQVTMKSMSPVSIAWKAAAVTTTTTDQTTTDQTTTTTGTNDNKQPTAPHTADSSTPALWLALATVSLCGLCALTVTAKKRKAEK